MMYERMDELILIDDGVEKHRATGNGRSHDGANFFLSSSLLKLINVGNNKIMLRPSSIMGDRQ